MQELLNILGSLGFNWHVALANFINFLIIFFILKKFVFGTIAKLIDDRDKTVKKGLEDGHAGELKLLHAEETVKAKIHEANTKSAAIVDEASLKAHKVADQIRLQGEKDAEIVLAQANAHKKEVEAQVEKDFAHAAPRLVASLFEKSLAQTMTKEANDALIANLNKA